MLDFTHTEESVELCHSVQTSILHSCRTISMRDMQWCMCLCVSMHEQTHLYKVGVPGSSLYMCVMYYS